MFTVTTNEGGAHTNRCGKIFKPHIATFWCSGEMASLICCWRAVWIGKATLGKKHLASSPMVENAPTHLSGNSILEQDFPPMAPWALHGSFLCRDSDPGGLGTGREGRAYSGPKSCVGFFWTLTCFCFHKYAVYVQNVLHDPAQKYMPSLSQGDTHRGGDYVPTTSSMLCQTTWLHHCLWWQKLGNHLIVSFQLFQLQKAFLQKAL